MSTCSRSGTRESSSWQGHRDWAEITDYPDYEELIGFDDNPSDTDIQPSGTRVAEVTTETQTLLKDVCLTRARNNDQLKTRNAYTLPKVEAIILDVVAPLSSIVEANTIQKVRRWTTSKLSML